MHTTMNLNLVFASILLICCFNLSAQPSINFYTDLGENNVSQGLFIKSAVLISYRTGRNLLEAGFQADLKNANQNVFSGFSISGSRSFRINHFPIEITGFWISTPFSELLRETNWGGRLKHENNHFGFQIGSNSRTYAFRQKAIREYQIGENAAIIHEVMNLMYSVDYLIKPTGNCWNIGASLTNIDHFILEQETNPMLRLNGLYKISTPLFLYVEAWYKSAGAANLSVNYFGFFFSTGIIWKIR